MASKDGGSAFPIAHGSATLGSGYDDYGLTVRDWFVGQIIGELLADQGDRSFEDLARDAYQLAEALVAVRAELDEGDDA